MNKRQSKSDRLTTSRKSNYNNILSWRNGAVHSLQYTFFIYILVTQQDHVSPGILLPHSLLEVRPVEYQGAEMRHEGKLSIELIGDFLSIVRCQREIVQLTLP